MRKNKKILGIDYGDKRVGIAIGLSESKIALPHEIIENKNLEFVLEKIESIIKEENIDTVVVGMPFSLDKKNKSEQLKKTEDFGGKLGGRINMKIIFEDERLSSRDAEGLLRGGKKVNKDDVAAALILQSYMGKN